MSGHCLCRAPGRRPGDGGWEPSCWNAPALLGPAGRRLTLLLLAGAGSVLTGCGDDDPSRPTPPVQQDVGVDTSLPDLGEDSGGPDLGEDSGPDLDSGDSGPPPDLGPPDQGPPDDLGPPDSGDGGTEPDPRFLELIALGKQRLAEARPRDALHLFEEALGLEPEHPDALFGAALAGTIDSAEMVSMLFSLVGQLDGFSFSRNEFLAQDLHRQLLLMREGFLLPLERVQAVDPDALDFEVEAAWLYLGTRPRVVFRGVFDGGDVHLMRATLSLLVAFFDVLAGQDFGTDLLGTANQLRRGFGELDLAGIGRILGLLMQAEEGHFLELHPEDGARIFTGSREHLAAVGRELGAAMDWLQAHPLAPEDGRPQVSVLEELARGASLRLTMHNLVEPPEPGSGAEELQPVLEEHPWVTTFSTTSLAAFAHASAAFDTPGELVPFRTEVVPILATVLHAALQLGLLDSLVGSLPLDLAGLGRDSLEMLLGTLLPLPAALDVGTFYTRPAGLRLFLPLLTPGDPSRFVAEWECPEELNEQGYPPAGKGLLCSPEALLTDLPHFVGEPQQIEADTVLARMAYFDWEDPTFHGLLQVDLSATSVPGWEEPGFRPPDLHALDAMLGSSLTALLALLAAAL